jgi:hypothetical protein
MLNTMRNFGKTGDIFYCYYNQLLNFFNKPSNKYVSSYMKKKNFILILSNLIAI